jgi:hypothetical protein
VTVKVLRVGITEEEWTQLRPLLTHHGELSFILRKAIREFITGGGRDVRSGRGQRERAKTA